MMNGINMEDCIRTIRLVKKIFFEQGCTRRDECDVMGLGGMKWIIFIDHTFWTESV